MKLLPDTHIWLWARLEPSRLPGRIRHALTSPENELWLSPICVWEIILLCRKGRLRVGGSWTQWVNDCWLSGGHREAPLGLQTVRATMEIQLEHSDPMDWLLAATARHQDLTLVTMDARLLAGVGYSVLPV